MYPKLNTAEGGPLNCIIGTTAGKQLCAACLLCLSDRYEMYISYRNRLCVQKLSYTVNLNRLVDDQATRNLLISHGTYKVTSNTQKKSIKSKGAGTPACTCNVSRGTGQRSLFVRLPVASMYQKPLQECINR